MPAQQLTPALRPARDDGRCTASRQTPAPSAPPIKLVQEQPWVQRLIFEEAREANPSPPPQQPASNAAPSAPSIKLVQEEPWVQRLIFEEAREANSSTLPQQPTSNQSASDVCERFLDPITFELMIDPVVCNDGRTYDRATAEALRTSPTTREPLSILVENVTLRSEIFESHPEALHAYEARKARQRTASPRRESNQESGEGAAARGDERRSAQAAGQHTRNRSGNDVASRAPAQPPGQTGDGSAARLFDLFFNGTPEAAAAELRSSLRAGRHSFADGSTYDGELRAGKAHGVGTRTFGNGDRYHGEFRNDELCGHGTFMFANGDRYDGEFENDKFDGRGTITYANGDRYGGDFRNGKFHGPGAFTSAAGYRTESWFQDGQCVSVTAPLQQGAPVLRNIVRNVTLGDR